MGVSFPFPQHIPVESLKAQHGGDVTMPELLSRLVADCPRQMQKAFSIYDRCRAGRTRGAATVPPAV
jgi:hypothetical protein